MAKVKMTPSEAITEVLVNEGVTHVTGIVGSAFMDMLDLWPTAGIEFIAVRHEQTAWLAAATAVTMFVTPGPFCPIHTEALPVIDRKSVV